MIFQPSFGISAPAFYEPPRKKRGMVRIVLGIIGLILNIIGFFVMPWVAGLIG